MNNKNKQIKKNLLNKGETKCFSIEENKTLQKNINNEPIKKINENQKKDKFYKPIKRKRDQNSDNDNDRETTKKTKNENHINSNLKFTDFEKKSCLDFDSKTINTISEDSNSSSIGEDFFEIESLDISKRIKLMDEKEIIIRKRTEKPNDEIVPFEIVKELLRGHKIVELQNYSFPFMRQSEFNYRICEMENNEFDHLFFYCPKCYQHLRNYSMPKHIFQYHFEIIDDYLSSNDIAICCADLMDNEFNKAKESLKNFISLAILFKKNNIKGMSKQKIKAQEQIEFFKTINISNQLDNKVEKAKKYLSKILPININRNKKRKYKQIINKTITKYEY